MLDSAFVDALLRHFGERGVQLAVARTSGEPVAMLLLQGQSRGLGVWSSYLPSQTQIGPSLIAPGLPLAGLFRVLPGYASELDLLCNDPRFGDWRESPGRPAKALPHALTMNVALRDSFDDYWAQRPRKLIQNMRRYLRRLQSEGGTERLVVISAADDMGAAVARYAELESRGWKGREGTAVSSDNPQGRFYAEVMHDFAARGEALVYELWLDDQLLASRMMLLRRSMGVMLKTAFDERFERFAPGRVLLLRTLEDLFRRAPGAVVEFYTNADADLLAWSTSQRWIQHVSVYRHAGLPSLYGLLRRGARGVRRQGARQVDSEIMVHRSGASVDTYVHVRELPPEALALMSQAEQQHIEYGADWYANLIDSVYALEPQTSQRTLRAETHQPAPGIQVGPQPRAIGPGDPGAGAVHDVRRERPQRQGHDPAAGQGQAHADEGTDAGAGQADDRQRAEGHLPAQQGHRDRRERQQQEVEGAHPQRVAHDPSPG
ncbi:hypothetical protein OSTOST_04307 [Ostertagia ostertagi]